MIKRDLHIQNRYGIHARPSSMISDLAAGFKSSITLEKGGRTADARNIMSLILLSAEPNSTVTAYIDGEDEIEAIEALVHLIEERRFDEE